MAGWLSGTTVPFYLLEKLGSRTGPRRIHAAKAKAKCGFACLVYWKKETALASSTLLYGACICGMLSVRSALATRKKAIIDQIRMPVQYLACKGKEQPYHVPITSICMQGGSEVFQFLSVSKAPIDSTSFGSANALEGRVSTARIGSAMQRAGNL